MFEDDYLIDEYALKQLSGRAVCVLTHDDVRHTGILTSCGSSSIVLNGERTARPAKRGRGSKQKAEISASETEEYASPSPSYWGNMGLEPPSGGSGISSSKAVISMGQIRAVWPI